MADTIIIPDEGKLFVAQAARSGSNPLTNIKVGLAKVNPSPADHTLTYADITFADYAGYSSPTTTDWTDPPVLNADYQAELTADDVLFLPSVGTQVIYAVFLFTTTGNKLIAVRVFASPFTISVANPLLFTPKFQIGPKA